MRQVMNAPTVSASVQTKSGKSPSIALPAN